MNFFDRYAADRVVIEIVNECLSHAVAAFKPRGPVIELGSYYDAPMANLCDRRQFFADTEFIGCDLRSGPGVDRREDAETLSFDDGVAGAIVMLEILEHLREPAKAISEAHRVLAKDGVLILSLPFWYRLHGFPTDYQRLTSSGVDNLLQGFKYRSVVALGAAVTPRVIFAIAQKDSADFAANSTRFRELLGQNLNDMKRRLRRVALHDRLREIGGLFSGSANISARYFDPLDHAKGYRADK
ncbi:MAG: methyltransferase domain-containing protein [Pseudomonadota bacterium]